MMHLKRITLPAGFAALAISQAAARPAAPAALTVPASNLCGSSA